MEPFKKCFHIKENDFIRAGEATISIQNILKTLHIDSKIIRRIAICGYEGEMNIVMHGGGGEMCIVLDAKMLSMEITDTGPGIENIEKAMTAGFSTAKNEHREMGFGAGMGLPNMKKNADTFQIESNVGSGTQVRMSFRLNEAG